MGENVFDKLTIRKAHDLDAAVIWSILEEAIVKRRDEGSNQWQDGYPNLEVVKRDIEQGYGYVCVRDELILGYFALIFSDDPAYAFIEGSWLTSGNYAVVHRVAVSQLNYIKGLATWMLIQLEEICIQNQVNSIRADTNFDNLPMLRIFEKLGYQFCGQVYLRGSARKAFEKMLSESDASMSRDQE